MQTVSWRKLHNYPGSQAVRDNSIRSVSFVAHQDNEANSTRIHFAFIGRTEKDVAQVLGITDRTVRNRLREALKVLRDLLESEGETIYG